MKEKRRGSRQGGEGQEGGGTDNDEAIWHID